MLNKTLACCYTRFSTEHQNQSSTIGQLKAIKAYCEKNNIEIIETYIDEAQTGTNTNRKDFQRLLADAPTALWDTVVVYNMSRLSRSVKDTLNIKEEFEKLGKKILSVIENQEETPEGDFFNLITYGMNELFVKQFARDSWRGLMVNANECKALGGVPPLGYEVSKDRKYVINQKEAEIVKIIFDMALKDYSYREIAKYLNDNGYVKRDGREFVGNFNDILRNEKYKGVYIWNLRENKKKAGGKTNRVHKSPEEVIRIPGGIPAIIDEETFDRIQKILDERIHKHKRRGPKAKYLLTGLIRCAYCDRAYSGSYTFSGMGQVYRSLYQCNGNSHSTKRCNSKDINMEYLNWYVKKLLLSTILNADNAKVYQECLKELGSESRRKVEVRLSEIELQKSTIREKTLEFAELLPYTSEGDYVKVMKEISNLTAQRATLELEEIELNNKAESIPKFSIKDIREFIAKYRPLLTTKDKELLRRTIFHLIEKIVIDNDKIRLYIDLMKYFNIPKVEGVNDLILCIVEDRNLVANKPLHDTIDFTNSKLKTAFEMLKHK